ncbi:hypothetical protein VTK73DRAFT_6267 [Phialemonium thermophilum]|uniref:Uncharacterized protein n=1 Tax=Phialemonium thermophilum TaxID=223376 RepID=A0ABR3V0F9_9PEZI
MTYLGILQQFAPDRGGDSNLVFEVSANLIFERSGFFSQRGIIMGGETDPGKSLTGPPFRDEEADVVLITTSQSRMFYYGPVDDPYYLAHSAATGDEYAHDLDATVYYATHPFALMACTDRAQLCNPSNGRCSPLSGNYRIRDAVRNNTLAFNRAQMATALRLVRSSSLLLFVLF